MLAPFAAAAQTGAPSVAGVSITSGGEGATTYGPYGDIDVAVAFSRAVTVTGAPRLALTGATPTLNDDETLPTATLAVAGFYTVGSDATIVIAAGATVNAADTATIAAVDDAIDNVVARSVTVTAAAANGQGIGAVTGASLTLTDDEGAPTATLKLSSESIPENGGVATVTLTVSASGDGLTQTGAALTVAAGETASAGVVTVAANDDARDAPDKTVTGDGVDEPDETVALALGGPADAPLAITGDGVDVTVLDRAGGADGPGAPEGGRVPTFGDAEIADRTWTRNRETAAFTLPAATGGDGAPTCTLSPALPDGVALGEATRMVAGAPAAAMDGTAHTWTATDADGDAASLTFAIEVWPRITFSLEDAQAEEGDEVMFLPKLSPPPGDMTVRFVATPGTAMAGADYRMVPVVGGRGLSSPSSASGAAAAAHATGRDFRIGAGRTEVGILVRTIDDEMEEAHETFTLDVVSVRSGGARAMATGTILDDDRRGRTRAFEAILAAFGRTVASEAVDVFGERFAEAAPAFGRRRRGCRRRHVDARAGGPELVRAVPGARRHRDGDGGAGRARGAGRHRRRGLGAEGRRLRGADEVGRRAGAVGDRRGGAAPAPSGGGVRRLASDGTRESAPAAGVRGPMGRRPPGRGIRPGAGRRRGLGGHPPRAGDRSAGAVFAGASLVGVRGMGRGGRRGAVPVGGRAARRRRGSARRPAGPGSGLALRRIAR